MLVVSDVHGAFEPLAKVAGCGEVLLVLGDFLNLVDYRTGEGIVADVLGIDFARDAAFARGLGDYERMRRQWEDRVGGRADEIRRAHTAAAEVQYRQAAEALTSATAYVTYGNVDNPETLKAHLPDGVRFVDGETVEIEGLRIGFVGGGVATPMRAPGEVTDAEMTAKLERLGKVDVLCSHLPPAVDPLRRDVITGREERSSQPLLDYILDTRPALHLFGDVHQPQAVQWRVGATRCRNVGYFRATHRPLRLDPNSL